MAGRLSCVLQWGPSELTGTSCVQHGVAPDLCKQRPPLHISAAKTLTPTPNTQVYKRAQAILFQLNGACRGYFIGITNVATLAFTFLSITFGGLIPEIHSDQFSTHGGISPDSCLISSTGIQLATCSMCNRNVYCVVGRKWCEKERLKPI